MLEFRTKIKKKNIFGFNSDKKLPHFTFRMILRIIKRKKSHFVLGKLENGILRKANFETSDIDFLKTPRISASALNGDQRKEVIFSINGIYLIGQKDEVGRIYYQKQWDFLFLRNSILKPTLFVTFNMLRFVGFAEIFLLEKN